jgi:hypothetical protein
MEIADKTRVDLGVVGQSLLQFGMVCGSNGTHHCRFVLASSLS